MADRRRKGSRRSGSTLEEEIERLLEAHPARSFKLKEIQRALRIPQSRYSELRTHVLALARAGRIASLPRRRFASIGRARFLEGQIEGIGERATHVRLVDDRRLPLAEGMAAHAVPGDQVRVKLSREMGRDQARIEQLLRGASRRIFGTLQRWGDRWTIAADPPVPGLSGSLFLEPDIELDANADGLLARGQLAAFDPRIGRPLVEEIEVLGAENHPLAAMSLRIARAGWPLQFSEAAEREATAPRDDSERRRDRCALDVFTIDPLDAKDHDDAVSMERLQDGGFRLGVHIADVAARVREGSALDGEARLRATSVYPPGQVLPMLPHALSSDSCSLHHGLARDTISVEIRYDAEGRRQAIALGRACIRSRSSLAYEHAERMLDDDDFRPPSERIADGASIDALRSSVRTMLQLAKLLRRRRGELGSLFVQRPEREFHFDSDGHVADVHLRPNLRSHWIIEEFMLEANRAVAETLHRAELPLLWRIHEEPDEDKVRDLEELLRTFGIRWSPRYPVSGSDYTELFERIAGRREAPLIHLLALRSLMKAKYNAGWHGHFGLAFERYTHFTSPIRRYPDLYNQRWLHRLIDVAGRDGWMADATELAGQIAVAKLARPADRAHARQLAEHCSEQEREAARLERDCADICAADALKPREGEEFEGMIVTVLASGVFVELDDTGLDGFVGLEQLPGDWYVHDPVRQALVGERTGRRFRLGQRVRVLLEYVDVRNGRTWLGAIQPLQDR